MYAYKDVLELAGLTTRLYTLLSTLHALPAVPRPTPSENTLALASVDICVPRSRRDGNGNDGTETPDSLDVDAASDGAAKIALVRNLSVELHAGAGEHLLITGTNGVGKTAVARVLAGLWPAAPGGGGLTRPERGVFVVPQRSYMVVGTLLDQYVSSIPSEQRTES